MSKVINIEDALKQCKIEVININAKDLLMPEYQNLNKYFNDERKWTTKQKNNFIESLFFGLFVQQLFIYEPNKQESFIIDGYNRIQTIKEFLNDEFPLEGLSKFNWQYNGKVFSRLNESLKYHLKHYPIIINKIKRKTSDDNLKALYINFNS
ncbi:putative uncharacterized protein [Fusobacterium sp. CAG:439]|mgnify:FL=1|nr:putative uncharacterized protein [Fusobacterium sp. CAG:439]